MPPASERGDSKSILEAFAGKGEPEVVEDEKDCAGDCEQVGVEGVESASESKGLRYEQGAATNRRHLNSQALECQGKVGSDRGWGQIGSQSQLQ